MLRLTGTGPGDTRGRPRPLRAGLVSIRSLLRSLPLFFSRPPGTPLRVLCIVALDAIHELRCSQPLPRRRRRELATFLDFQACTNALWDHKPLCTAEYQVLRQRLEQDGLGSWITEYVCRLGELERGRPSIGGDPRRFDDVRAYREAVVRLSLAAVTGIALNAGGLEEALRTTDCDPDLAVLFRMAMQCQIIDDVVDYRKDLSGSLPSFLTASSSLPYCLAATARASRAYQVSLEDRGVLPLRMALRLLTALASLTVLVAPRLLPGRQGDGEPDDHLNPDYQAPNPNARPTSNSQTNVQANSQVTVGSWLGSWFGS